MPVLHAGIDEGLRAVGPLFRRILSGIQAGRPGVLQYINAVNRIRARGHGSKDFVDVGRVDVIINGDNPFCKVGAARALRGDRENLLCVARITLLE